MTPTLTPNVDIGDWLCIIYQNFRTVWIQPILWSQILACKEFHYVISNISCNICFLWPWHSADGHEQGYSLITLDLHLSSCQIWKKSNTCISFWIYELWKHCVIKIQSPWPRYYYLWTGTYLPLCWTEQKIFNWFWKTWATKNLDVKHFDI